MIPPFDGSGLLPAGIHWAVLNELRGRYALNDQRRRLFGGFERGLVSFRKAGCRQLYLDGSFITSKEFPADYDACWEAQGVNLSQLDPVLLEFGNRRAAQKAKYYGEFFPAHIPAEVKSPFRTFLEFFQTHKDNGSVKGIIGINLVTNL
jgi:hypothetical protein